MEHYENINQLVITRDGNLEFSYLEALERAQKVAALKELGRQAILAPVAALRLTGRVALAIQRHIDVEANPHKYLISN